MSIRSYVFAISILCFGAGCWFAGRYYGKYDSVSSSQYVEALDEPDLGISYYATNDKTGQWELFNQRHHSIAKGTGGTVYLQYQDMPPVLLRKQ